MITDITILYNRITSSKYGIFFFNAYTIQKDSYVLRHNSIRLYLSKELYDKLTILFPRKFCYKTDLLRIILEERTNKLNKI